MVTTQHSRGLRTGTGTPEPSSGHQTAKDTPDRNAVAARASGATKVYGDRDLAVHALDGVDIEIARSTFTAVMGPSGSGKSTLIHCLAGLDSLTGGEVQLGERTLTGMSEKQLTLLRRDHVGFVFQSFNLIPTLTALENITLPSDLAHRAVDPAWLDTVIDTLGLRDRLEHRPARLPSARRRRLRPDRRDGHARRGRRQPGRQGRVPGGRADR